MSQPGNNVSASNKSSTRRRKGVVLAVVALLLFLFVWSPWGRVSDPVYQGKRVSEWFELYCAGTYFLGNEADYGAHHESSKKGYAESVAAFREIQGDAIPFLVNQLEARQTMGDRILAQIKAALPNSLAGAVPKYSTWAELDSQQMVAARLLGEVGEFQHFLAAQGIDTGTPSIALAVEPLRKHLAVNARRAAKTLWHIGPPAAPAVPDLIQVARSGDEKARLLAVETFGFIGRAASNAVPFLIELAEDATNQCHEAAIGSLSNLGRVAEPALPVLTSLLSSTNAEAQMPAVRAIATIGITPIESVEQLERLRYSENQHLRTWATLALWNRTPDDQELTDSLVAFLQSDRPTELLACLVVLGTNASSLRPFVEPLAEGGDPRADYARRFHSVNHARKFLYKLDNPVP